MADLTQQAAGEVDESTKFVTELSSHLEESYDITVSEIVTLDTNVFRIEKVPAPSWVARVFPSESMLAERSAKMLSYLRQAGFPAEKCAQKKPITALGGHKVLVTGYLRGSAPRPSAETFRQLGDLLGKLHALPFLDAEAAVSWSGGAWHHLCFHGGPHEEIAAAMTLLSEAESRIPVEEHAAVKELKRELERIDDFGDLPRSLIHPDFVPNNIIEMQDGTLIPIDWAGNGSGPRAFSLGWLLFAAAHDDFEMIKAVADGYRPHIILMDDEISHLTNSILTRQLSIACWEVCNRGKKASAVAKKLPLMRKFAEEVTIHSAAAFKGEDPKMQVTNKPEGNANPETHIQDVGTTSLFTAAIRAEESRRPNRLFEDPLAQALASQFAQAIHPPGSSERADSMRKFLVARTVFLDDLILSASRDGCRKIVLLGAGMDTRAFRLQLPKETCFFELDSPRVLDSKTRILNELAASPIYERTIVAGDLCTDWTSPLISAGFRPEKPTIWIIEGVFVYLDEETVNKVVEAISALSAAGSRMGMDLASPHSSLEFHLWKSTAPSDSVGWLAGYGWDARISYTIDVLRAKGRVPKGVASGKKASKTGPLLIDATRKLES